MFLDRQGADVEGSIGWCRRYPPQIVMWPRDGVEEPVAEDFRPDVRGDDWCGEFKEGPNDG